jgi:hypothetical protein
MEKFEVLTRREFTVLALATSASPAMAAQFSVDVSNEGVAGTVTVNYLDDSNNEQPLYGPKEMAQYELSPRLTVPLAGPRHFKWKHVRKDNSAEKIGEGDYGDGNTIKVYSKS